MLCPGVIDVAHWDSDAVHGHIDEALTKAMQGGILAVIAKATQGKDYVDPTWKAWVKTCAGRVLFGAYHFASNTAQGDKQADFFLAQVTAAGCDLKKTLLCLDFERNPNPALTMSVDDARKFAVRVHEVTGRWPVLYGDVSFHSHITDPNDVLGNCPLWPAMYGGLAVLGRIVSGPKVPPAWKQKGWSLWQYSDGRFGATGLPRLTPGFGGIDRSVFRGSPQQLSEWWLAER